MALLPPERVAGGEADVEEDIGSGVLAPAGDAVPEPSLTSGTDLSGPVAVFAGLTSAVGFVAVFPTDSLCASLAVGPVAGLTAGLAAGLTADLVLGFVAALLVFVFVAVGFFVIS